MITSTRSEKQFGELFEAYLFERMEQLREECRKTKRYLELSTEEKKVYKSLESLMTVDMKKMLVQYTDILYDIMLEQQNYYYKQGLIDFGRVMKIYSEASRATNVTVEKE